MTLSRMEIQAVTELLEREAQSPSKDDYKPPGNRGFFILSRKTVFKRHHRVIYVLESSSINQE
jgi:hypothetical protein